MKDRDKNILLATSVLVLTSLTCDSVATAIPATSVPDSNQPPLTETSPSQETQISTGVLSEVTETAKHDQIVSSLPSDRPEAQGGNSEIKTFQIAAGGNTFDLAMYQLSPEALANQLPIELKDAEGQTTQVVEGVALFTQSNHYDGSTSMERLIAIPVKTDSGVGVTWVYDENGYPTEAGQSIDLTRAVFAYNVPVAAGSKLSFAPLTSKPEEIVRYGLPNPLTITIDGDPPSPMTVDVSLSNGIGTPVSGESTAVPPPTPELPTATPEPAYFSNAKTAITLAETKGQYAEWVKDTCKENITMDPANIQFVVNNLPSVNMNDLGSNIKTNSYETGYKQARNIQLCDNNIRPINPREFGLEGKEDISIVPYIYMDTAGNQVVFQFAIGKNGIEMMKQNGFFSDKNGPRLQPADKLPTLFADIFISGESGGPEDASAIVKGNTFYESQGVTKKDVFDLLTRIAATGVFSPEDQQLIESTVFLPSLGIGPSANQ